MALRTTQEGQLLKELVTARGGSQPYIEGWNFMIQYRFPRILDEFHVTLMTGAIIRFSNPQFVRPNVPDLASDRPRSLTAAEARRTGKTLDAQMFITLQMFTKTPQVLVPIPEQRTSAFLGRIPVMVLSALDHNSTLSEMERYAQGEPEKDPGAYFIIGGMEKFMNSPEHLRTLFPSLYDEKGKIIVRYTSQTITGQTIQEIFENDGNNTIETVFSRIGIDRKKAINIFYIFYCLGLSRNTIGDSLYFMELFITGPNEAKRKKRLRQYLETTVATFNAQTEGNANNIFRFLAPFFGAEFENSNKPNRDAGIVEAVRKEYLKNIRYFPGGNPDEQRRVQEAKIRTLAYMVVKYVDHMNGYRELDDRDSWGNKRIDTPALNMEAKFFKIFQEIVGKLQEDANKKTWTTVEDLRNGIDSNLMAKMFRDAFTKGTWGDKEVPIVEPLKRDTHLAVIAQIRRITTPINRRAKIREKRMVHTSQWNTICPEATPEGEACGLVKDPAISIGISLDRDQEPILARLQGHFSTLSSPQANTSLFVNGIHLGFCNGSETYSYLVGLRRTQAIYFDTALILNQYNELWVSTSGGRLVIPYFVVDPDTQKLLLDVRGLRGASFQTLLNRGVLEYLDNAEQEQPNILIAKTVDDLKEFRQDKLQAEENLRQAEEDLRNGKGNEAEIANSRTALINIDKLMKFTHSIIDPSSILGIAASTMPYPQHNPSARITYQCLRFDTPILMGDGTSQRIDQVKKGDEVITFNPKTREQEKTRVLDQIIRETDKQILVIRADSKEIFATNDHLFFTSKGWVPSGLMIPNNTRVGIRLGEKIVFSLVESIQRAENCLVADITVESKNHSFIANGFCVHNSQMARQALGADSSRVALRFDTNVRTMIMPDVPIVATDMHEQLGLNKYPAGATTIIAITTRGQNQEDAISLNKASLQRGMFMIAVHHSYKTIIKQSGNIKRTVGIPVHSQSQAARYSKLDPNTGIVRQGQYVYVDDCLVGITVIGPDKEARNGSLFVEIKKEGIVEEVLVTHNAESLKLIEIRLREVLTPERGDKFASRYSQKGILGELIEQADMPFIISDNPALNGVTPDVLFNPHGIPSRMTIGKLIEILASKAALMKGERVNATAFRRTNIRDIKDALQEVGFSRSGMERMVDGTTGRIMDAEIFVGAVYYQILRHLVKYKIQARGTGTIQYLTRQPVSGVRREGGLRFGEMERDVVISSGSSELLRERFMLSSDVFRPVACQRCGLLASNDAYRGEFRCQICRGSTQPIRLELPYPYRLLTAYLSAAMFKLRADILPNA